MGRTRQLAGNYRSKHPNLKLKRSKKLDEKKIDSETRLKLKARLVSALEALDRDNGDEELVKQVLKETEILE